MKLGYVSSMIKRVALLCAQRKGHKYWMQGGQVRYLYPKHSRYLLRFMKHVTVSDLLDLSQI